MATSKPASAAASVKALPILREPPVIRAAPRVVAAKAVLVETAEFVIVQGADDDEKGEDGVDGGHGWLRVRSSALEVEASVRKRRPSVLRLPKI